MRCWVDPIEDNINLASTQRVVIDQDALTLGGSSAGDAETGFGKLTGGTGNHFRRIEILGNRAISYVSNGMDAPAHNRIAADD